MESPCINICALRADDICAGCWRSLDEIAAWSSLTEAERRRIMADLPARKAEAEAEADKAVISNPAQQG